MLDFDTLLFIVTPTIPYPTCHGPRLGHRPTTPPHPTPPLGFGSDQSGVAYGGFWGMGGGGEGATNVTIWRNKYLVFSYFHNHTMTCVLC